MTPDDIHCCSLLLGDTTQVVGGVIAVRGRVVGLIRGDGTRGGQGVDRGGYAMTALRRCAGRAAPSSGFFFI